MDSWHQQYVAIIGDAPLYRYWFFSPFSEVLFKPEKEKLKFISYEQATHGNQWATFIDGQLPYVYLKLDAPETLDRLRQDLQTSFTELGAAAEQAIAPVML